jgi:ribosome-binding factor A
VCVILCNPPHGHPPEISMSRPNHRRGRSDHSSRPQRPDRKTLQLCGQIADTLNYVLSGELGDDLLRNLYVESVRPAPDATRLLVSVAPLDAADVERADQILQKLHIHAPRIRSEVAQSIHRRKTPELSFVVVQPTQPGSVRASSEEE